MIDERTENQTELAWSKFDWQSGYGHNIISNVISMGAIGNPFAIS